MSPVPPRSHEELLSDPSYPRLKNYLIESTGLAYYANKDADLARRLRRRMSGLGPWDCASYLERLRDPANGPTEMDALIAEITIGETYFFRHTEHFDALRNVVLPDLIARNGRTRQLRIWCAGCADGAEPYSLSIILRRDLAPALIGWNVSILGTDINRQFLANARAGRFDDWSFRAMPVKIRHSCFQNKGKQWEINPEFKTGVSFQFHNLVEDPFPPPVSGFLAFDLIVCRNVMIYFGPEQSRRIVRQFHDALEPGAWLVVGPSEPNMTYFTFFRAVNEPGVTLYQRPALPAGDRPEASALPEVFLPFAPGGGASQPAAPLAGAAARPALPVVPELAPAPTLADLRQRADQGDWEGAARFGKGLTETDNLNPLAHFHYALVLEQMGDYAASERSFRKAIYLDRQTALAHYHLGLLLQSRGHRRQAMRCFDNTLEVLASRPGDSLLLEAGEITVAELSKLVRMRLEILRAEVAKEPI